MAYGGLSDTDRYQEFLECSLCLETLKSPKLLPCGHSFCLDPCLRDSLSNDLKNGRYRKGELRCPMCKTMHILGEKGLDALPPDHRANTLLSMIENVKQKQKQPQEKHRLCAVCDVEGGSTMASIFCLTCREAMCTQCENHHGVQEHRLHAVVSLSDDNINTVLCKQHPKRYLIKYCETCSQSVCNLCVMQTHGKHALCDFKNAECSTNPIVSSLSTDLQQLRSDATKRQSDIAGAKSASITQSNETKQQIDNHIDKLISKLQQQRKTLHSKVEGFLKAEVRSRDAQENQLKSTINDVDILCNDLNQVILPLGITNKITRDGTLPLDSIEQRVLIAKQENSKYLSTERARYAFVPNRTHFQAGDVIKENNREVAKPTAAKANAGRQGTSSKASFYQVPIKASDKMQSTGELNISLDYTRHRLLNLKQNTWKQISEEEICLFSPDKTTVSAGHVVPGSCAPEVNRSRPQFSSNQFTGVLHHAHQVTYPVIIRDLPNEYFRTIKDVEILVHQTLDGQTGKKDGSASSDREPKKANSSVKHKQKSTSKEETGAKSTLLRVDVVKKIYFPLPRGLLNAAETFGAASEYDVFDDTCDAVVEFCHEKDQITFCRRMKKFQLGLPLQVLNNMSFEIDISHGNISKEDAAEIADQSGVKMVPTQSGTYKMEGKDWQIHIANQRVHELITNRRKTEFEVNLISL